MEQERIRQVKLPSSYKSQSGGNNGDDSVGNKNLILMETMKMPALQFGWP